MFVNTVSGTMFGLKSRKREKLDPKEALGTVAQEVQRGMHAFCKTPDYNASCSDIAIWMYQHGYSELVCDAAEAMSKLVSEHIRMTKIQDHAIEMAGEAARLAAEAERPGSQTHPEDIKARRTERESISIADLDGAISTTVENLRATPGTARDRLQQFIRTLRTESHADFSDNFYVMACGLDTRMTDAVILLSRASLLHLLNEEHKLTLLTAAGENA
jgi:hypothetical protein